MFTRKSLSYTAETTRGQVSKSVFVIKNKSSIPKEMWKFWEKKKIIIHYEALFLYQWKKKRKNTYLYIAFESQIYLLHPESPLNSSVIKSYSWITFLGSLEAWDSVSMACSSRILSQTVFLWYCDIWVRSPEADQLSGEAETLADTHMKLSQMNW